MIVNWCVVRHIKWNKKYHNRMPLMMTAFEVCRLYMYKKESNLLGNISLQWTKF